ncbi:MAG: oxygen-insensitive NAD(P)H nitroreductase [Candidatus Pacebacteria bacterium]|nr:oxygen-insensitive NAD(P)H nitroreductase [Candidatus Paceibacterota bacterium]
MSPVDIATIAKNRKTCKAFDPKRVISAADMERLKSVMIDSASSVNSQPWHFIIASTPEGRSQVAKSTQGASAYNEAKVLNCSHVVVFCRRIDLSNQHAETILQQEIKDGRLKDPEAIATSRKTREYYFGVHRDDARDANGWMEKQLYLSYGMVMLAAAAMGIDSCPMEGFDRAVLDDVLGLEAKGLASVVLLALGYGSSDDFNAKLPKSRLPAEMMISSL